MGWANRRFSPATAAQMSLASSLKHQGLEGMLNVEDLRGALIVSCQAHGDHPLRDTSMISALAQCAERGGAAAIRADGPEDIRSIREAVSLPIVGIYKVACGSRFFITPTLGHARNVVAAGADMVAVEATLEYRPDQGDLETLIRRIREELGVPVVADISTFEEALRARKSGAELVATTLSGYTRDSPEREEPDLDLVKKLAEASVPVVAEGHVRTPEQVGELFNRGAHSVVVGTAITDPVTITSWFARAARSKL
jgi:N-acylglucosamine-6-phosphate 2-epimerase